MPRGDSTGPMGAGPRTGRGMGYCAGYDMPGFATPGYGLGTAWRRGQGGGFGWRNRFFAGAPAGWYPRWELPSQEETLQALKAEADWLKDRLDAIKKRVEELEG